MQIALDANMYTYGPDGGGDCMDSATHTDIYIYVIYMICIYLIHIFLYDNRLLCIHTYMFEVLAPPVLVAVVRLVVAVCMILIWVYR